MYEDRTQNNDSEIHDTGYAPPPDTSFIVMRRL